jgi:hypothetical protein
MCAELERRYSEAGRESVDEYLVQLDEAADQLELARRHLAEFIASEFPLTKS